MINTPYVYALKNKDLFRYDAICVIRIRIRNVITLTSSLKLFIIQFKNAAVKVKFDNFSYQKKKKKKSLLAFRFYSFFWALFSLAFVHLLKANYLRP